MVLDRYPTNQPEEGTYASHALRNNSKGTDLDKEALERFKIREICEGWLAIVTRLIELFLIRWQNYQSMFFDDAYIATSWKQGNIDEFVQASKDGFAKGSSFMYILHRIIGSSVETNPELTLAVCKMKITITCRFTFDGVEMDNEADCRFFFMLEKRQDRWGVCFYTLLFDKDKFIPVNPAKTFHIPEEDVEKFPSGYRYLAWAESKFGTPLR
ncbi:uncharacterized protein N7477_004254 [Penicillium maclennaniae]|uniref:uncharacterized protein n=1 Tax=Penicillium maclennaniae TaxID=1343394 RepID=UPI00253FAE62|nr:uncharacterized protein N7477_004254 [Penicillium maclennaniae]KAJ5674320.1 hypothetical protein N7477_004254 [Penicillium maclennaniae]